MADNKRNDNLTNAGEPQFVNAQVTQPMPGAQDIPVAASDTAQFASSAVADAGAAVNGAATDAANAVAGAATGAANAASQAANNAAADVSGIDVSGTTGQQFTHPGGFTNSNAQHFSTPGSFTNTNSHNAAPVPPVNAQTNTPMNSAKVKSTSAPVGGTTVGGTKQKSGAGKHFGAAFAGGALAVALGLGGYGIYNAATASTANANGSNSSGVTTTLGSTSNTTINASDEDTGLASQVAAKALPSVAAIDVYTKSSSTDSMYGSLLGQNSNSSSDTLTESSLGSGVVLSKDGYIITNYHVVEGADALKVTVGGNEYDGTVVGEDSSSDIAVVKIEGASDLTPIELGDSDNLTIGEWVMSIGSPFGLEQSVATGIVSATSRSQIVSDSSDSYYGQSSSSSGYMIYPNLIQTDAAINPGNSGGALVDSDGKLIGINTLITSYSGNYSGVGFAIPVNYAVNIAQQIIDGKTPTHAQLGVSLSSIDSASAQRYGFSTSSGAYVSGVYTNSGAAEAGIQTGDIITKFDGNAVESASDLMIDVRGKNPGDTVTVEINRDGQTQELQVTLGSDEDTQATLNSSSNSDDSSNSGDSSNDYGYGNGYGYGYGNGSDGYGYGYGSGSDIQDLLNELFGNGYSDSGSGNSGSQDNSGDQGSSGNAA